MFKKVILLLIGLLVAASVATAIPAQSPYPVTFWINGAVSAGSTTLTSSQLAGFKVFFYSEANNYLDHYASAESISGGQFAVNALDDVGMPLVAGTTYYLATEPLLVGGSSYGVNPVSYTVTADDVQRGYINLSAGFLTLTSGGGLGVGAGSGLYIRRGGETPGSACIISWDPTKFSGSNPAIYVMTGSGTGEFNNSYDPAIWTEVFDGTKILPSLPPAVGTFSFTSGVNEIDHLSQVGQGSREVYYKALAASVSPATGTAFQDAPAVGKCLVTAAGNGNYNMIGVPFLQKDGSTFVDVYSQAINQANVEIYKYDNTQGGYLPAFYSTSSTSWDNPNIPLTQGEAAWVYNPNSQDITMTIVGGVPSAQSGKSSCAVPISGGGKYNMISNPYPQGGNLSGIGLLPLPNAEVYYFDNVTHGYVAALSNGTNWDNDLFIMPGTALWYYNSGSSLSWQSITR